MKINELKQMFFYSKTYFILMTLSIIMMILNSNFLKNIPLAIFILFFIFAIMLLNTILFYKKKLPIFFLLLTFFLFTMGQYLFKQFEVGLYYDMFAADTIIKTILLQGLSIYFIFLGSEWDIKDLSIGDYSISVKTKKIISILFLVFFVITLISKIEIGIRVWNYGYLVIYTNEIPSKIPNIVHYLSQLFPILFFYEISVNYKEKKSNLIILMYIVYLCATLLTGARGEFGIGILMIVYIYIRKQSFDFNLFKYIKKNIKTLFVSLIVIFITIIFLNFYNSFRVTHELYIINPIQEIKNFFVNQSTSVNVIAYSIEEQEYLSQGKHLYAIGPVLENINSKLVHLGINCDISNYKTSLAKEVSIIALGEQGYASGQGVGSQYIAELYLDYGYIGLIIYSFFIGVLLILINKLMFKNCFISTVSLILLQSILYIPRGQALQFINSIVSFNYLFITIFLMVCNWFFIKFEKNN